jgi:exosortase family protein XrtF
MIIKKTRIFPKHLVPIFNFLLIFLLTFFLLTGFYDFYLRSFGDKVDKMSSMVGIQAAGLLRFLNFEAFALASPVDRSMHVGINGFARVKVIEGCNGISVMVLFLSFLLGFSGSWRHKAWFVPAGLLAIHVVNIGRVAILCWAVYAYGEAGYPIYKEVFTVSIYVLVLVLWYVWVQKFGVTTPAKK